MVAFLTNPPEYIRTTFFILFLLFFILSLLGLYHDARSNILMRRNLLKPRTFFNLLLDIFTARQKIEKAFEHQQYLRMLTEEELEISFSTQIIGQGRACQELAHYLYYFLNLSNIASPMNVFLLHGPKETGKTTISKMIAHKLHYPLIIIEENAPLSSFLALQSDKNQGKKLIIIKEISTISLEGQHILKNIIDNHPKNIFIFTHSHALQEQAIPAILSKKIQRDIQFNAFTIQDIAKIIAKNLENKIQNAGFYIQNNIFPPSLIQEILASSSQELQPYSLRQKINYFENIINPSLIAAQQKGAFSLSFYLEDQQIKIDSRKERHRL